MAINIEALGIHQLTVQERLLLIEQIWDSLPDRIDLCEVPEWHLEELARRRARTSGGSAQGKPWREVLASLETTSLDADP